MSIHCFTVPALDPEPAQSALNAFLAAHTVVALRREFHAADGGTRPLWLFCVEVLDHAQPPLPDALRAAGRHAQAGQPRAPVDYREVLGEADFEAFAALRRLRKQLAQDAGVPVYAVFSNEQLAALARRRAATLADLDAQLDRIAAAILAGAVPLGEPRCFTVHDPKRRLITAPSLDDRVLHHAIVNLAEPRFEQALVGSAYACRPGKGVHAAVLEVQRQLRRWPWFVKVDVDAYFPSIDHGVLLALLARRFKGAAFLALLQRIVEAGAATPDRGLPIGALLSQHCANAYLDSADRLLLAHPGVRGHVRYMDDIVWFCDSREAAVRSLAALRAHLSDDLKLALKPGVQLGRSAHGLAFCGTRVRRGVLLAGPRKRARYCAAVRRLRAAEAAGIDEALLQRVHDGALAALAPADMRAWRRRLWWGDAAAQAGPRADL